MAPPKRFLAAKVRGGSIGMSCGEYASGDGEGKFRSDPKTHLFSSSTARFKPPGQDEYKAKSHAASSNTRSGWAKGDRFPVAAGGKPASGGAPASKFKIDDYDAVTWSRYKTDPSCSMSLRMGQGSGRFGVPRFQNPASGVSTSDVGPGAYSPRSVRSDRRNTRRPSSTKVESSFASKTNRFSDGISKGALGPGEYGVPKDPRWEWKRGEPDPSTHRPYGIRPNASFVKPGSQPRLSKKERHGDESQLGPGSHWSQSMEDMHSVVRPNTVHSVRGTSGFLASERPALYRKGAAAATDRERPISYFSMSRERTHWRAGRTTSAGSIGLVKTAARFVAPGEASRPSSSSSTYISRKRLTDAWKHEAEISGRTVQEVQQDLWYKPIGDLSSIYDNLYMGQ